MLWHWPSEIRSADDVFVVRVTALGAPGVFQDAVVVIIDVVRQVQARATFVRLGRGGQSELAKNQYVSVSWQRDLGNGSALFTPPSTLAPLETQRHGSS